MRFLVFSFEGNIGNIGPLYIPFKGVIRGRKGLIRERSWKGLLMIFWQGFEAIGGPLKALGPSYQWRLMVMLFFRRLFNFHIFCFLYRAPIFPLKGYLFKGYTGL